MIKSFHNSRTRDLFIFKSEENPTNNSHRQNWKTKSPAVIRLILCVCVRAISPNHLKIYHRPDQATKLHIDKLNSIRICFHNICFQCVKMNSVRNDDVVNIILYEYIQIEFEYIRTQCLPRAHTHTHQSHSWPMTNNVRQNDEREKVKWKRKLFCICAWTGGLKTSTGTGTGIYIVVDARVSERREPNNRLLTKISRMKWFYYYYYSGTVKIQYSLISINKSS